MLLFMYIKAKLDFLDMKIEVDYENYVFDINRDSEERRALFEKEYQKVVKVNNRVNAANKWKKKNVINGEAKCVFGNALNDIKKTICGQ